MVLLPLAVKEAVAHITVIEREQDVIDLILPQLKPHIDDTWLTVIHEDIFEFKPDRNVLFDVIYFDICADNYAQMKTLHRKFTRRLNRQHNPKAWMSSWCRQEVSIKQQDDGHES